MPIPRPRILPRSRERKLALLIGAVALPALALAVTAFWLTLRVSNQVAVESARYNAYLAEKVIEAYERELVDEVRSALSPAELVSRDGGTGDQIRAALASRMRLFEAPHFVPLDELEGYSIVTVEGQLLIYGDDPTGRRDHPFASMLLSGPDGNPIGAGGWWFNPRSFLAEHLRVIVVDRLPQSPRMYGGLESTRNLAVTILDPSGNEVAHVREGTIPSTARLAIMTGPFEGFGSIQTPSTPSKTWSCTGFA